MAQQKKWTNNYKNEKMPTREIPKRKNNWAKRVRLSSAACFPKIGFYACAGTPPAQERRDLSQSQILMPKQGYNWLLITAS